MSERELRARGREPQFHDPERLLHEPEIGTLISQANAVYRAGLDESGAFQRLSERLEAPARSGRWQGLALGAVLSAAAGWVVVLGVFDEVPSRVAVGPELSTGRRVLREEPSAEGAPLSEVIGGAELGTQPAATRSPSREPDGNRASDDSVRVADSERPSDPRSDPRSDPPFDPPSVAQTPRERQLDRREASARSGPSALKAKAEAQVVRTPELAARPGPKPADGSDRSQNEGERPGLERSDGTSKADLEPQGSNVSGEGVDGRSAASTASATAPSSAAPALEARLDCSELVQKDARAAESCYAQQAAESSGLSAEVALYELARLRRDVQQDAKGALAALNEHRDRFPRGSLRNEVGLSRVELLSELGRSREALTEAEALLASAQGQERAAELYVLRGDIFRRDLTDFARAAQEYSKAEAFGGGFGAEATRLRGLSLEALGDVKGALAAYHRYLSGAEQPRKLEVNRRVEALTSGQRGKAP